MGLPEGRREADLPPARAPGGQLPFMGVALLGAVRRQAALGPPHPRRLPVAVRRRRLRGPGGARPGRGGGGPEVPDALDRERRARAGRVRPLHAHPGVSNTWLIDYRPIIEQSLARPGPLGGGRDRAGRRPSSSTPTARSRCPPTRPSGAASSRCVQVSANGGAAGRGERRRAGHARGPGARPRRGREPSSTRRGTSTDPVRTPSPMTVDGTKSEVDLRHHPPVGPTGDLLRHLPGPLARRRRCQGDQPSPAESGLGQGRGDLTRRSR